MLGWLGWLSLEYRLAACRLVAEAKTFKLMTLVTKLRYRIQNHN